MNDKHKKQTSYQRLLLEMILRSPPAIPPRKKCPSSEMHANTPPQNKKLRVIKPQQKVTLTMFLNFGVVYYEFVSEVTVSSASYIKLLPKCLRCAIWQKKCQKKWRTIRYCTITMHVVTSPS
jgi:hypothetical protein